MYNKSSTFNKRVGTRAQVMHGNAKMTGGRLMKKDLKYNKAGKIVSKKLSRIAKKEQRLQKAGYKTQKGVFELFQKQIGGDSDEEEEEDEDESKATVPPRAAPGAAPLAPIAAPLAPRAAMAPGGSAAAAIPNLNELITRAFLLKESINIYSENQKTRAIDALAEDIKKLYFNDIDIDTIKTALVSHKYNIENVIVNLVTTKINTARQQFNLTKRQYTNQNKEKIINKIKANTPIGEIIGSYLDFST